MPGHKPLLIIPDYDFQLPGYQSTQVKFSIGSFSPGAGVLVFNCRTKRQYLNVQRMFQLYSTGSSPLLGGSGMNSEDILMQTSVCHELRHFHDWLVSFSYFDAARRKLFLGANTLELLRFLPHEEKEAFFPLPLLDWVILNETDRTRKIEEIRTFYGTLDLNVCDFPHFSIERLECMSPDQDHFRNTVLVSTRQALAVQLLLNGYSKPGYIRPFDVFEISAIAIQLQTIIDRFGFNTALDIYKNNLHDTYYDQILKPIDAILFDHDGSKVISGPYILTLIAAMAFWAICAAPESKPMDVMVCPAIRFMRLRAALLENRAGLRSRIDNIDRLLSYFDELSNEIPTADRVAAGTEYFRRISIETEAQLSGASARHPTRMISRYWEELIQLREELQQKIFDDPWAHLRGTFENSRAHELTIPPIVVNCAELDPLTFADDPLGKEFSAHLVGQVRMRRYSDRINALKDELAIAYEADILSSKIFYDQDIAQYPRQGKSAGDALETLIRRRCISFH